MDLSVAVEVPPLRGHVIETETKKGAEWVTAEKRPPYPGVQNFARPSVRPSFNVRPDFFQCPSDCFSMSVRPILSYLLKTIGNQQKHKMINWKNGKKRRFVIFVYWSLQRRFWRDWHGSIALSVRFQSVLLSLKTATCRAVEKIRFGRVFFGAQFWSEIDVRNSPFGNISFLRPQTDPNKTYFFMSSLPHRFWREWHRSEADTEPYRSLIVSSKTASFRLLHGGTSYPPWRQIGVGKMKHSRKPHCFYREISGKIMWKASLWPLSLQGYHMAPTGKYP